VADPRKEIEITSSKTCRLLIFIQKNVRITEYLFELVYHWRTKVK